jgi:hypothetical protein
MPVQEPQYDSNHPETIKAETERAIAEFAGLRQLHPVAQVAFMATKGCGIAAAYGGLMFFIACIGLALALSSARDLVEEILKGLIGS